MRPLEAKNVPVVLGRRKQLAQQQKPSKQGLHALLGVFFLFVLGVLSIALPVMAELTYSDHDAQLARLATATSNASGISTEKKATVTTPLFPVWFSAAVDWYMIWDLNTEFSLCLCSACAVLRLHAAPSHHSCRHAFRCQTGAGSRR